MNTDDTFADVTLVCDDGSQIRAHKVVLGASSPILKNMLITDNHIQYKHEGVKYACKQCDKQFTTQSSLLTHIRSKHMTLKCSKVS